MSIRARLLMLVLAVLLPALAAALWLVAQAYAGERAAQDRNLIGSTRALATLVERELRQRAALAQAPSAPVPRDGPPVPGDGPPLRQVTASLLPQELQALAEVQRLPPGWISAVVDSRFTVVARHPDGSRFVGRTATADLIAQMKANREAMFDSVSLDGRPVTGFFSTSPQGWVYLSAMPRGQYIGRVPDVVLQVGLGALALLLLAVVVTAWQAKRIAAPINDLTAAVHRVQSGDAVRLRPTGIVEYDLAARALVGAAETMRRSESNLSAQVADAVERTREAERRVSQSQRVEALGRLTGGVAHDFNNLLGVISNSAHLVQRLSTDPQLEAPVAATLRAVDVGNRLIQQLQRFAGRQPLHPQTLGLRDTLRDVKELMRTVLGKRISILLDVTPGTRPIRVDGSELELALINLSLNARDAMPDGGTVWLQACNAEPSDLHGLPPGEYVRITVTDDGTGLDEALAARVFEPFFTTKPFGKATGLGLSQVHGFCVQAGGTARLNSTLGLGTTVTLLLPAFGGAAATPVEAEPAPLSVNQGMPGARVLLVEDNEELGDVTASLLEIDGFLVARAQGAGQALEMVDGVGRFDVVLSDIVMPGDMDGLALAKRLRERVPKLPVVLISGYSDAIASAGDFTVLRKPCTPDILSATLRAAVGSSAANQKEA